MTLSASSRVIAGRSPTRKEQKAAQEATAPKSCPSASRSREDEEEFAEEEEFEEEEFEEEEAESNAPALTHQAESLSALNPAANRASPRDSSLPRWRRRRRRGAAASPEARRCR